jgi:acyl-CoA synthetase (AMP-forming)/AMP-acid ligase II
LSLYPAFPVLALRQTLARNERGYMFILDRKKDMIVSGGFNIFPREVEDVLSQHADVAMEKVLRAGFWSGQDRMVG